MDPRRATLPLLLLAALGAGAGPAAAQIFASPSDAPVLLLSNHASASTPVLLVAPETPEATPAPPPAGPAASAVRNASAPAHLLPSIRAAAHRHGVREDLLVAVIATESNFNPRAVSRAGAKGLMQLMPATARRFGVRDVFAVDENLQAGTAYLRELLDRYGHDLRLALAAYNAGEGAVDRAGGRVPGYPETEAYVRRILSQAAPNPAR